MLGPKFGVLLAQAHLAKGEYIAVQTPRKFERIWDRTEWTFDQRASEIAEQKPGNQLNWISRKEVKR